MKEPFRLAVRYFRLGRRHEEFLGLWIQVLQGIGRFLGCRSFPCWKQKQALTKEKNNMSYDAFNKQSEEKVSVWMLALMQSVLGPYNYCLSTPF